MHCPYQINSGCGQLRCTCIFWIGTYHSLYSTRLPSCHCHLWTEQVPEYQKGSFCAIQESPTFVVLGLLPPFVHSFTIVLYVVVFYYVAVLPCFSFQTWYFIWTINIWNLVRQAALRKLFWFIFHENPGYLQRPHCGGDGDDESLVQLHRPLRVVRLYYWEVIPMSWGPGGWFVCVCFFFS